jgi:hypothetical protein
LTRQRLLLIKSIVLLPFVTIALFERRQPNPTPAGLKTGATKD